jgi:TonB family protein
MMDAQKGNEGWVKLNYVIDKDGSVLNPIVESSSGLKGFEYSAIRAALEEWRFTPATKNGIPIQQCKNSMTLEFLIKDPVKAASTRFVRRYKHIKKLIFEKKLIEAKGLLDRLTEKPRKNFYEDSYYWTLLSAYYQMTGDTKKELDSLNNVAYRGKKYLKDGVYSYILIRGFQLALLKNKLDQASNYYHLLELIDKNSPYFLKLNPYYQKMKALIKSDSIISISGEIESKKPWYHTLIRQEFSFSKIKGQLRSIDIRCQNYYFKEKIRNEMLTHIDQNKTWRISKSWGKCRLLVYGENKTTFKLFELPIIKNKKI